MVPPAVWFASLHQENALSKFLRLSVVVFFAALTLGAMTKSATAADMIAIDTPASSAVIPPVRVASGSFTVAGTFTAGGDGSDSILVTMTESGAPGTVISQNTATVPSGLNNRWSTTLVMPLLSGPPGTKKTYVITARAKAGTVIKASDTINVYIDVP